VSGCVVFSCLLGLNHNDYEVSCTFKTVAEESIFLSFQHLHCKTSPSAEIKKKKEHGYLVLHYSLLSLLISSAFTSFKVLQ